MSLSEYAPETPDILSPTNWKTAVLAVPLGAVFGIAMRIVVDDYVPAWPATVICAMGLMWYLSRRETLSDAIGTAAAALIVPTILFPIHIFVYDIFITGEALRALAGTVIFGVGAVFVSIILAVTAVLAFRH
jgi:hypothetical protein